jgi:hypothetical protein
MLQVGRNLIDAESGALRAKGYLILDRDSKYTDQFRRLIGEGGTNVIRLAPQSPNLNAYAERFVRSIKSECLNQMIFIGQASLRRAAAEYMVPEYMVHYHEERNHQGLDNRLIRRAPSAAQGVGHVHRKQRLVECLISIAANQSDWRRSINWTIRDNEDEEFAHGANRSMTVSARKTAPHGRIPSYYEFATHMLTRI